MIFADRLDAARRLATELGGAIDESSWSFVSDAMAGDEA